MATRVLEMQFINASGRTSTVRVPNVIDPYTGAAAAVLMDSIVTKNIFTTSGGDLISKDSARIVVTDVTDLELS
jgi:hypothetical protein